MISMVKYKRADVVVVPFPFIAKGETRRKLRPALVISDHSLPRRYEDAILIPITSKIELPLYKTEVIIDKTSPHFSSTGLMKTSIAKCEMLMTIPVRFVVKKIGEYG